MNNEVNISNPTELGVAIRAVRIAADLTQADAAALCGVSPPFLNGVERGKPTAQVGLILVVCRGLGIQMRLGVPEPIPELAEAPRRKPRSGRQR